MRSPAAGKHEIHSRGRAWPLSLLEQSGGAGEVTRAGCSLQTKSPATRGVSVIPEQRP